MVIGEYLADHFAGRRDGVWSLHPAVEFFCTLKIRWKGLCALAFVKGLWEQGPDPEESGIYNLAGEADATKPCGSMWRRSARSVEERASAITASCHRMQRDRRT